MNHTDLECVKTMLGRCKARYEEEALSDEGVVEVRAQSTYAEESCEVVFVFDREGTLTKLHVMDPTKG